MQSKELYASIELAEDELRLIVGELFMSRLNVLKYERVKMSGITNGIITDADSVSASIVKAMYDAEKTLGYKIKSVILCIPSNHVKCIKRRVSVPIGEGSKRIRVYHAKQGLAKVIDDIKMNDNNMSFVNVGSIKYINGGITSRSIPVDEQADVLKMDIDLLLVDRNIVYSYVNAVELSGLKVLDVCLDSYAIAEESAILENSVDQYIILNTFEKNETTLTLFYKGRLVGSEGMGYGYNRFIQSIKRKYHLSYKECLRLLKECSIYNENEINGSIVYLYLEHNERKQITRQDIYECVRADFEKWCQDLNELNAPIIESGKTKMIISGSGADIIGLDILIKEGLFECESEIYVPETIGVRRGCYSAALGAIYAHNKWAELLGNTSSEIEITREEIRKMKNDEENAFTSKLKSFLLNK